MTSKGTTPAQRQNKQGGSPMKQKTIVGESQEYVVLDKDLVRGLSEKEVEIEHLKTTIIALTEKIIVIDDVKKECQLNKDLFQKSEASREQLHDNMKKTCDKIDKDTYEHQQYQNQLINENEQLRAEIQELKKQSSLRQQDHLKEIEKLRKEKDDEIKRILDEKEKDRQQYESKIDQQEIIIKRQSALILEQNSTILRLQEIIKQKEDVEDQLRNARAQIAELENQKQKLHLELETASDYILELEEKVYKANKTSLELLRQLKDAEVEIETLKNYIIELKQRIAVYIPVRDDAIDKKLAEFINNYPERQKLKIMFMRESEGVYQFGTKRVAVRVDKDKINIRVGGGYLSIDEFLDQYTPAELEKLERKDPLKKFSEKIAVQKTIVGKEIRESSPVRSPGKDGGSPGKN